jgi:hypothetical protein
MKAEHAEQIVAAAEAAGLAVTADAHYSGRGMDGEETSGIIFPGLPTLLVAVAEAVRASQDPDDLIGGLWGVRTDSLGRDTVAY